MGKIFIIHLIIAIIIIIILFIRYLNLVHIYKEKTYFKETQNSFWDAMHDKGINGEFRIFEELEEYEDTGAKFLFNTYLPKPNGEKSEVDLIMIYKSGIYVIESKNYSGWIFGDENRSKWMQTFSNGDKNQFYNPIKQNQTHIKWLRTLLNNKLNFDIVPFSLIVFSDECKLKKITNTNPLVKVVHSSDISDEVEKYDTTMGTLLSEEMINQIYNLIKENTIISDEEKEAHIQRIQSKFKN